MANRLPPGWDDKRVGDVLAHYETQTEDEALAEDELTFEPISETVFDVPLELVPAVRELIGKYQAQLAQQNGG